MLASNKIVPDYDDTICKKCPYCNQKHLRDSPWIVNRDTVPLGPEINGSATLLVFQAPGEEEWRRHKPLQPTVRRGGTAGRRLELSWSRQGTCRSNYDITNVVQCFPGKGNDGRDKSPVEEVIEACSCWLYNLLVDKRYRKVISFGNIANQTAGAIITKCQADIEHIQKTHPNGGLSNPEIDALWR